MGDLTILSVVEALASCHHSSPSYLVHGGTGVPDRHKRSEYKAEQDPPPFLAPLEPAQNRVWFSHKQHEHPVDTSPECSGALATVKTHIQGWETWLHAHLNEKLKSINIC